MTSSCPDPPPSLPPPSPPVTQEEDGGKECQQIPIDSPPGGLTESSGSVEAEKVRKAAKCDPPQTTCDQAL